MAISRHYFAEHPCYDQYTVCRHLHQVAFPAARPLVSKKKFFISLNRCPKRGQCIVQMEALRGGQCCPTKRRLEFCKGREKGGFGGFNAAHDLKPRNGVFMNQGKTIFGQVMACVQHWEFRRIVEKHDNAIRVKGFSTCDNFLAMNFAQITYRESLREIEAYLDSQPQLRHHLGFRSRITRSTLVRANVQRPWQFLKL